LPFSENRQLPPRRLLHVPSVVYNNTPTAPSSSPTKEVVVNVHAAQTTTSEQSQLGVITVSKRKLMTHENSARYEQTVCVSMFNYNCPSLSRSRNAGRRRLKGISTFFFGNFSSRSRPTSYSRNLFVPPRKHLISENREGGAT